MTLKILSLMNSIKKRFLVGDYEQLRPYIEKIVNGENDILWPGKPLYFAKQAELLQEQNIFLLPKSL